jgi:hypothetical protein
MLEQFQLSLIILLSTIILVIALIYIIKIVISNKTIAYYVFKECYENTNVNEKSIEIIKKQSFFYFDKIEDNKNKSILQIDEENKYTFYLIDFTRKDTEFTKEIIPIIINHEDDSSLEMFKILCKINNISTDSMIFQKKSFEESNSVNSKMFAIITQKHLNDIDSTGYKYSLYNYKNIKYTELSAILPYIYLNFLITKSNLNMTYKFIQFDSCIYTNDLNISYDKKTNKNIENMYNMFGYIIYTPEVKKEIKNEIKNKTDSRQQEPRIKVVSTSNIVGKITKMINNDYIQFKTNESMNNVFKLKFKIGDVIILQKQINKIENNTYYYIADKTMVTSFIIDDYVEKKNNTIDFITNNLNDYKHIQINDNLYFTHIKQSVTVYDIILQNDYVSIKCLTKEKFENFEYECVTNPHIKFQHQCESDYTKDGIQKNKFDVWDKRCESHTECPFFSLTNNYNGKCNDNGYCEMPIGVENIGYRKYTTHNDSPDCPFTNKDNGECIFENNRFFP